MVETDATTTKQGAASEQQARSDPDTASVQGSKPLSAKKERKRKSKVFSEEQVDTEADKEDGVNVAPKQKKAKQQAKEKGSLQGGQTGADPQQNTVSDAQELQKRKQSDTCDTQDIAAAHDEGPNKKKKKKKKSSLTMGSEDSGAAASSMPVVSHVVSLMLVEAAAKDGVENTSLVAKEAGNSAEPGAKKQRKKGKGKDKVATEGNEGKGEEGEVTGHSKPNQEAEKGAERREIEGGAETGEGAEEHGEGETSQQGEAGSSGKLDGEGEEAKGNVKAKAKRNDKDIPAGDEELQALLHEMLDGQPEEKVDAAFLRAAFRHQGFSSAAFRAQEARIDALKDHLLRSAADAVPAVPVSGGVVSVSPAEARPRAEAGGAARAGGSEGGGGKGGEGTATEGPEQPRSKAKGGKEAGGKEAEDGVVGKWTKSEDALLLQALDDVLLATLPEGKTVEETREKLLVGKVGSDQGMRTFSRKTWHAVAERVGRRTRQSCYDRARRLRWESTKKEWSEEELRTIASMYQEFGPQWKRIADAVERSPMAVKDIHRHRIAKPQTVQKGAWSKTELELLQAAMKEGQKAWKEVAARVKGRTLDQCRQKASRTKQETDGEKRRDWTAEEDKELLERLLPHIESRSLQDPSEIVWEQVAIKGRKPHACKERFRRMSRAVTAEQGAAAIDLVDVTKSLIAHGPVAPKD